MAAIGQFGSYVLMSYVCGAGGTCSSPGWPVVWLRSTAVLPEQVKQTLLTSQQLAALTSQKLLV